MNYTVIDKKTYPRRDHFEYLRTLDNPHVGVTVDVDVTNLLKFCKDKHYSFYLIFMHCVALAADEIEEFHYRILNDEIIKFEECSTSHTESKDDGTYSYCTLHHHMPFDEYIAYAKNQQDLCKISGSIDEEDDVLSQYFISCLPWIRYTSLIQPTSGKDDSNPRFTWGKYEENDKGKVMMPVSVLAHHGLIDGIHLGKFYENLNRIIKDTCN